MRNFLIIFGAVLLALFAYHGSMVAIDHYRTHRAHEAAVREADEAMREWAETPTTDPLVKKWHKCVADLTYTKDGGYAEVKDADRYKCTKAYVDAGGKP
jgi:hypothetical protein